MIQRSSYPQELARFMHRRRLMLQFEGAAIIAMVAGASLLAVYATRAVLITLLNISGPALPPGCC